MPEGNIIMVWDVNRYWICVRLSCQQVLGMITPASIGIPCQAQISGLPCLTLISGHVGVENGLTREHLAAAFSVHHSFVRSRTQKPLEGSTGNFISRYISMTRIAVYKNHDSFA